MLHEMEVVWEDLLKEGSINRPEIQREGVLWSRVGRIEVTRFKWVPWAVQKIEQKDK